MYLKKNLESSERFEFVQFHPNYDYTDFVEGIRPVIGANDTMGFKLEPGIFKVFCEKAKNAQNDNGAESGRNADQKFVFVIDEINRGEISKIFGELFFSIDPSYRGITGAVKTQYANMKPGNGKFYIPDNVYIIGTMNDIDRSVDTFDFAMRRRFRFIEIKANENTDMLDALGNNKDEAIQRMTQLNNAISQVEDLNSHYHIGASYFLKLKDINYEALWEDYLEPLLADYVKGMFNEEEMMESFKLAYNHSALELGSEDEID
ncbi:AAA family ATPase [Staphylococcus auricularis]|uniref:McrB family protein n=1 Tax=Staphylococcus auricularis TaxID=29379 RepID=UPI001EF35DB2|nr:AAA family ATPase [Staphylococcus auricularis]